MLSSFTSVASSSAAVIVAKKPKTIEDTYQKKTSERHVLDRPDTWVGSVDPQEHEDEWACVVRTNDDDSLPAIAPTDTVITILPETAAVADPIKAVSTVASFFASTRFVRLKSVIYTPAFLHIFKEIIMNAVDVDRVTYVDVDIDPIKGEIRVENDGRPIPIHVHDTYKVQIVDMIFGDMFTGSNYDDSEQRTKVGRNGIGAKGCNLFSTEFEVQAHNAEQGLQYTQTWVDNKSRTLNTSMATKPMLAKDKSSKTIFRFIPDAKRLNTPTPWSDETIRVLQTLVYTVAATTPSIRVRFRRKWIPPRFTFDAFVKMHMSPTTTTTTMTSDTESISSKSNNSWMLTVPPSSSSSSSWSVVFVYDSELRGVGSRSFVNSGETAKGGTHVQAIWKSWVTGPVCTECMSKRGHSTSLLSWTRDLWLKKLKQFISVFVNATVVNPQYDSQTKERLTTPAAQLEGCLLFDESDAAHKKLVSLMVRKIMATLVAEQSQSLEQSIVQSTNGSKKASVDDIVKLQDAPLAGDKRFAHECTLILVEGDSAKALAIAGISVLTPYERQRYGVFPLKGKFLNVSKCSRKQLLENEEVVALKRILGLRDGMDYSVVANYNSMRYGHVMVMSDQDTDGSHIRGY
jgi:DNA topoisomerase-2